MSRMSVHPTATLLYMTREQGLPRPLVGYVSTQHACAAGCRAIYAYSFCDSSAAVTKSMRAHVAPCTEEMSIMLNPES